MLKPKKYRAKILTMYLNNDKGESVPQYEEVEGYLAPISIRQNYSIDTELKTNIVWGLYSTEAYLEKCTFTGMGMSVYQPMVYTEFTDLEEIEDD